MAGKFPSLDDMQHAMSKEVKAILVQEIEGAEAEDFEADSPTEVILPDVYHEHCATCGRSSDEIYLMQMFYRGSTKWVCLRCLKRVISPEMPSQAAQSAASVASCSDESSSGMRNYEMSTEPIATDGSPMSMFD